MIYGHDLGISHCRRHDVNTLGSECLWLNWDERWGNADGYGLCGAANSFQIRSRVLWCQVYINKEPFQNARDPSLNDVSDPYQAHGLIRMRW